MFDRDPTSPAWCVSFTCVTTLFAMWPLPERRNPQLEG
jgi:hypothetical protein